MDFMKLQKKIKVVPIVLSALTIGFTSTQLIYGIAPVEPVVPYRTSSTSSTRPVEPNEFKQISDNNILKVRSIANNSNVEAVQKQLEEFQMLFEQVQVDKYTKFGLTYDGSTLKYKGKDVRLFVGLDKEGYVTKSSNFFSPYWSTGIDDGIDIQALKDSNGNVIDLVEIPKDIADTLISKNKDAIEQQVEQVQKQVEQAQKQAEQVQVDKYTKFGLIYDGSTLKYKGEDVRLFVGLDKEGYVTKSSNFFSPYWSTGIDDGIDIQALKDSNGNVIDLVEIPKDIADTLISKNKDAIEQQVEQAQKQVEQVLTNKDIIKKNFGLGAGGKFLDGFNTYKTGDKIEIKLVHHYDSMSQDKEKADVKVQLADNNNNVLQELTLNLNDSEKTIDIEKDGYYRIIIINVDSTSSNYEWSAHKK